MKDICTCGETFRDAEDFRDHMPCPGTPREQANEKLAQTRKLLDEGIAHIERVYDHYKPDEVEKAPRGSQLWLWNEGLKLLRQARGGGA